MSDKTNQVDSVWEYKRWWIGLVVASIIFSFASPLGSSTPAVIGGSIGLMLGPLLFSAPIWGIFRLVGKPMSPGAKMNTFIVIWVLGVMGTVSPPNSGGYSSQDVTFNPDGCEYSVSFDQEPEYYTKQKQTLDGRLKTLKGAQLQVSGGRALTRAECVAFDNGIESVTQKKAMRAMQEIARDLGLSRPNFSFESKEIGRVASITGVKDTERGRATARVINYFGPSSIMTLYVISSSKNFQTKEMTRFLESIHVNS